MEKMNINYSAPNLVAVCIDTKEETGRLYHRYMEEPEVFLQFSELILKMEGLFDRIGYPQAALEIRQFHSGKSGGTGKDPMEAVVSPEMLMSQRGKVATFLVHVKLRQMATWQGEALWVEGNRKEFFDSELDFLKILDAANR